MIEIALRKILKQVKSSNPETRYEALGKLFEYKQQDGLEVQIDVLKEVIKTAASTFPERVDHWDNPSFYLIDFVCDFPMPEVVEGLMKHFDGLDLHAKERAIEFLLLTEDEEVFYFLEDKIVHLINTEDYNIPIGELSSYPMLIKGILDVTLDKIQFNHYKYLMYDLILSLNNSGVEQGYKKEFVLASLLADYESVKQEYLKFDPDYSTKYVYTAWKDSYLIVRNKMRLFISLMKYYFSQEIAQELNEALRFNDPLIKTEALLVCISKNLQYPESVLLESAEHIESAEMTYWELDDKNWEHLYPITERKQPHLAKTRLFYTVINSPEDEGVIRYPEDIQVVDQIETENSYGQPIRYYVMRFKEHQTEYIGWVGGYALEAGDDAANLWDGSYTDFIEFDSASIEKHKQDFFEKREEEQLVHENSVYYESSPKLSKGAWFFLALLIAHWFRQILSGFNGSILLSIFFTVVGGGLCLYELTQNKKRKITIIGDQLIMQDGSKQNSIYLHDIKKIEYNKKHIFIYNRKQELAIKFPLRWVHYDVFSYHINEHTAHLKETPFIQS
ncbi:hypothetical protein KHA93_17220 [Bacillus sp. FJAT-49732]|uniref:Uncharacterized protein n=1 Tax=Lederbergia citrisecunda TaxID=2833583 RepID=A0A942YM64_9BACI|nr:hypothetical protein [Lederbergia citrisecunda]MBS4201377.1 hypothetical protein [Lederbergia citrisecunda]